jgi:hypothetical protein
MADEIDDQRAVALAALPGPIINAQPITTRSLGWALTEQAQERGTPAGHRDVSGQPRTRLTSQHHCDAIETGSEPIGAMGPAFGQGRETLGEGAPRAAGQTTSKPPDP